jgi:hypothetical protein
MSAPADNRALATFRRATATPLREQILRNGRRPVTILAILAAFLAASGSEIAKLLLPTSWLALPGAGFAWGLLAAALTLLVMRAYARRQSRRVQQLLALSDLARRAAQPAELQGLLDAALRHAVEIGHAAGGTVRLVEDSGAYVTRASLNIHPEQAEPDGLVPEKDPGLTSAEPVLVHSASDPPGEPGLPNVVIPLLSNGRLHGALTLLYRKKQSFSMDELEALRAIGAQAGPRS